MARASGRLTIDVEGRPPMVNQLRKMGHAERRRVGREWKAACQAAIHALGPPGDPFEVYDVSAWMGAPDRRSWPDCDGIATAVKWAVDELVRAEWIADDAGMRSLRMWRPMLRPDRPHHLALKVVPIHE